jgi:hypothetical protein
MKIIKVKSCRECPYCVTRAFKKICKFQKEMFRKIRTLNHVLIDVTAYFGMPQPDFCPLENEK